MTNLNVVSVYVQFAGLELAVNVPNQDVFNVLKSGIKEINRVQVVGVKKNIKKYLKKLNRNFTKLNFSVKTAENTAK